jgi:hypothetical protein
MKNGFRTQPQPSRKQAQQQTNAELENLQMSVRVSQMMIQQLMQNVKNMGDDLGNAFNQLFELQYKYNAIQKHLNLDSATLASIANEQRLEDFNEASVKADLKEDLDRVDVVDADSTITITSSATDESGQDRGIFRSRLKLSESGVPDLITKLTGKRIGEKVTVALNGINHEIELLSIRSPKTVTNTSQEELH